MNQRRTGFTLIELMMVLAIAGLIAAMAAPRFASANMRYRVKAAARRIQADMALARSAARASSAKVTMDFKTTGGGSYTVSLLPNVDRSASGYSVSLGADPYRMTGCTADFGGSPTLGFNGFGVGTDGAVSVSAGPWVAKVQLDGVSGVTTVSFAGP